MDLTDRFRAAYSEMYDDHCGTRTDALAYARWRLLPASKGKLAIRFWEDEAGAEQRRIVLSRPWPKSRIGRPQRLRGARDGSHDGH